jgi:hypothetical protein
LRREIADAEVPPGLVAYVDDRPVGWTRVGPRSGFPRVSSNSALARVVEFARDHGATSTMFSAAGLRRLRARTPLGR